MLPFRALLCLVLVAAVLAAQPMSPGGLPSRRIALAASDPAGLAQNLQTLGYDVLHGHGPGSVELVTSDAELAALAAAGFSFTVLEEAGPLSAKLPQPEGVPTGYRSWSGIQSVLQSAAAANPGLMALHDLTVAYAAPPTHEGRHLLAAKISDNAAQDEDEPAALLVAMHHAREIVNPEICLYVLDMLLSGYGSDPTITALVDSQEIWIVPCWNPDGLEHVWNVNNLWRKNRRPNPNGTFGVDQNRNYPMGWDASCGGSTFPGSSTYRGPSAASEPETQTMLAFARDRRFSRVLDFHSHGQEVLLSYTCSTMPAVVEGLVDAEGASLAQLAGYTTRDPVAEGEHQVWEMAEITSFAYLVETHTSFQPAWPSAQAEAAQVWPLVLAFLQRDIPLAGHVTDAATGLPVPADIQVSGVTWQNGETRTAESRFGRYHLWLPSGSYDVTWSAPGYQPHTQTVAVGTSGTVTVDVSLQPAAPPFSLVLSTSGAQDLHLELLNIPAHVTEGYCLFSLATPDPQGGGALVGLYPDALSLALLTAPLQPGSPLHWTWPVASPLFPASPFDLPPGTLPFGSGTDLDGVAFAFGPAFTAPEITPVVRTTF